MITTIEQHSTKEDILKFLLKRGEATAQELAESLDISPQAIRRHLKDLEAEKLILHQAVQAGMGRPQYLYHLSQEGRDRFPNRYPEFAVSFLDTLTKTLGKEQTSLILHQHWQQKAMEYRDRVGNGNLKDRVAKLVEIRRSEGYMAEWYAVEGTEAQFILTEHNCAISQVANTFPSVCGHELEMFAVALKDCDVERTHSMVNGQHQCGYLIKEQL